jgi:hypothetical protein
MEGDGKIKKVSKAAVSMENYYSRIERSPILDLFMPWKNFTRASPVLWIFLASLLIWIIGSTFNLSLFVWVGGFLVLLFVAVALALFESL